MTQTKQTKDDSIFFDDFLTEQYGDKGTKKHDNFEAEVDLELISCQLRMLRQKKDVTIDEMAKYVGVGTKTIEKMENGDDSTQILHLMKAFHLLGSRLRIAIK